MIRKGFAVIYELFGSNDRHKEEGVCLVLFQHLFWRFDKYERVPMLGVISLLEGNIEMMQTANIQLLER